MSDVGGEGGTPTRQPAGCRRYVLRGMAAGCGLPFEMRIAWKSRAAPGGQPRAAVPT